MRTNQRPASILLRSITTQAEALIGRLGHLVRRIVDGILGTLSIANATLSSLGGGDGVDDATHVEHVARRQAKQDGTT